MYKTNAEVQTTRRDLITVEMDDQKTNVDIYVRNAIGCAIADEAAIGISPEGFIGLVYPILQAKGYRLEPAPEGF